MSFAAAILAAISLASAAAPQGNRGEILRLAQTIEGRATNLAESNFEHFKGRSDEISDQEQAVLFESEAFAASCRLFVRLTEERTGYFGEGAIRTNLYNAYARLARSFGAFEAEMKRLGVMPYEISDIRRLLDRLEGEFARWPSTDNPAFLSGKYVKARDASVWLIERTGRGAYVRRAFRNLESLYRYNYDRNRGRDPWQHLVEVPEETLARMAEGEPLALTFEGRLVIEQSKRANRPVYLIENGKKRGLTSPRVVERLGGWGKVFEVPVEVVAAYPEGEPVN
jgi:hypothetical protein